MKKIYYIGQIDENEMLPTCDVARKYPDTFSLANFLVSLFFKW